MAAMPLSSTADQLTVVPLFPTYVSPPFGTITTEVATEFDTKLVEGALEARANRLDRYAETLRDRPWWIPFEVPQ